MRLDLWLLSSCMLGMGVLNQQEVSHDAVLLAASINHNLDLTIEGEPHPCSFVLIDSRITYSILPGNDWQFFAYINRKSSLADLCRKQLQGRKVLSYNRENEPMDWLSSFVSDNYQDFQAEELFLKILEEIFQIQSYSLDWSRDLQAILHEVHHTPLEKLTIQGVSDQMKLERQELLSLFQKITGIPLADYIVNLRLFRSFQLIQRGRDQERAYKETGLPGSNAVNELFSRNYGLDLGDVIHERPTIRFNPADLMRLYGYSLSSMI